MYGPKRARRDEFCVEGGISERRRYDWTQVSQMHTHTYRRMGLTRVRATSAKEAKEWRWLIEEARLKSVDARMVTGTGGLRGF